MPRILPWLLALSPFFSGCQPSRPVNNLIALFTDFGSSDPYVAQLKGAIKTIAPSAEILDLSHANAAFDISAGRSSLQSWILASAPVVPESPFGQPRAIFLLRPTTASSPRFWPGRDYPRPEP
ncbi:MAG: hypothetical protein EBT30_03080 [Verrucomicrobia bacterium]|nr:hypothetical protein [Verrucomicrobiota bacterium]